MRPTIICFKWDIRRTVKWFFNQIKYALDLPLQYDKMILLDTIRYYLIRGDENSVLLTEMCVKIKVKTKMPGWRNW